MAEAIVITDSAEVTAALIGSFDSNLKKLENAFGAVLEGTELENFTFFTEALGVESEARQEVLDILEESGVELDDKALAVLDLALMSGEAKV